MCPWHFWPNAQSTTATSRRRARRCLSQKKQLGATSYHSIIIWNMFEHVFWNHLIVKNIKQYKNMTKYDTVKYWNMMIKQWISGGPMVRYSASLQHLAALLKPEWLSTPAIAKNLKWLPQSWGIRIMRDTNPELLQLDKTPSKTCMYEQ